MIGIVVPMNTPMTCCAEALVPVVVIWMLFGVEALPMTLFGEIVNKPPRTCSALMFGLAVAGKPVAVSDPMVLLATVIVPAAVP